MLGRGLLAMVGRLQGPQLLQDLPGGWAPKQDAEGRARIRAGATGLYQAASSGCREARHSGSPSPRGKRDRQTEGGGQGGKETDTEEKRPSVLTVTEDPGPQSHPAGMSTEAGSHPTIHYQCLCIQPADKWANQGDPAPRTAAVLLATSDKDSGLNYPPLAASPSGLVGPRRLPCSVSLCLWAKWSSTCSGVSSREIHCRSPHPKGDRA